MREGARGGSGLFPLVTLSDLFLICVYEEQQLGSDGGRDYPLPAAFRLHLLAPWQANPPPKFEGIMNQFSYSCVPYGVSKLAALARR